MLLNANDRRPRKPPVVNVKKLTLPREPPKRPLHWQRKRDSRRRRPNAPDKKPRKTPLLKELKLMQLRPPELRHKPTPTESVPKPMKLNVLEL